MRTAYGFYFASATSIGYGDFAAVTLAGRIITVVLTVYSIAVIAIFTAVITSFFMDVARFRANDSAHKFIDDLEHLPDLSKEELEALSQRVKNFQKRIDNAKGISPERVKCLLFVIYLICRRFTELLILL